LSENRATLQFFQLWAAVWEDCRKVGEERVERVGETRVGEEARGALRKKQLELFLAGQTPLSIATARTSG